MHSKRPFVVRGAILWGTDTRSGAAGADEQVCLGRKSLLDLKDVFNSFVHAGHSLLRCRAIYPKPADAAYHDISKQNEFLVKSVFDGKANFLYHRDCIREVFSVSNQRLARLGKSVQTEASNPVVLPRGC